MRARNDLKRKEGSLKLRRVFRRFMLSQLLLLALLLDGCGTKPEPVLSRPTICVVLKAMDSVIWLSVEDGLKQAAAEYDVNVNILWPSKENNVEAQNTILEDVIASNPDAIAVSPCDSAHMEIIGEALSRGIPCFYIDTKSSSSDLPYIGADNIRMGELGAEALENEVKKGKVAVIVGNKSQSAHRERMIGFRSYIEKCPNLTLCGIWESVSSGTQESIQCMQEILKQHPDVKGVFCTSAMMVLGAMREQEKEGTDVKLVGVDMQSDAMIGIEDGKIHAMVGQNGFEIGFQTVRTIVQYLQGEEISDSVYVETPLITDENVEEYLERYLTERGEMNDEGTVG